jgi:hypothetical protein
MTRAPQGRPFTGAIRRRAAPWVRCKILVDGRVISAAAATGSYNIASCEISRDPLSGKWANTNSG